jgi:CRP-like cAMP-binding protein
VDAFIDTITRTSIFAGLSREDLARVAGKLDEVTVAAGTTIITQAEPGDALYVVQTGAVEECFGEIALFTDAPRSALAIAVSVPWWRLLGLVR